MRGAWTTYSAVVTSLSFSPGNVQKAVFSGEGLGMAEATRKPQVSGGV